MNYEKKNSKKFIQFWAQLLPKIGLVFIFLLPISGFLFFCCQCQRCCDCGNSKRKNVTSFEILSYGYLVLLIGVQTVMIGSLMLSLESIDHTINNANDINKFVRNISEDAKNVTEIIFDDVKCEMEMTLPKLFNKIKYRIRQLPSNMFNSYEKSDGCINMQSAINNLENISCALNETIASSDKIACNIRSLPLPLQTKMENLTTIINTVINFTRQINKKNILEENNALIDDTENQTIKIARMIYNGSVDVIEFIRKGNEKVDEIHEQYVKVKKLL
uniref:Uncharacterized protein n=1 Tax=Onchocerca volvulus TaxID=6282 RepID=A0A8R1TK32_ONCVO